MKMTTYLSQIEYAATHVLALIWKEHRDLDEMKRNLTALTAETKHGYSQAEALRGSPRSMTEEDYRRQVHWDKLEGAADDVAMGAGLYWQTYFGPDKNRHQTQQDITELKQIIQVHEFSVNSLSGSILQYGKQGISLCHGAPSQCPDGRAVLASQNLKTVIWEARNQSMHWEDGKPRKNVVSCFGPLSSADARFSDFRQSNMAFRALSLLGWQDFTSFSEDMMTLQ